MDNFGEKEGIEVADKFQNLRNNYNLISALPPEMQPEAAAVLEGANSIQDPAVRLSYLQQQKALWSGKVKFTSGGSSFLRVLDSAITTTQALSDPAPATTSTAAPETSSGGGNPYFNIPTVQEATNTVRQMPEVQAMTKAASGMNAVPAQQYVDQKVAEAFAKYNQSYDNLAAYKAPTVTEAPAPVGMAPLPNTSSQLGFDTGAYLNANANKTSSISAAPNINYSLPSAPSTGSMALPSAPGEVALPSAPSSGSYALPSAPGEVTLPNAPTLPGMTEQPTLEKISQQSNWEQSITPEVQSIMKSLGRSGAASSSYADRLVGQMISSEYAKWQQEVATLELQKAQQEVADKLGIGNLAQQGYATATTGVLGKGDLAARNYSTATSGAVGMAGVQAQNYATATSGAVGMAGVNAQNYATATSGAVGMANVAAQNYATATSGAVGMANAQANVYGTQVSGEVGMANVDANRYATTLNAANQARSIEVNEQLGLGELDIKRRQAQDASAVSSYLATMQSNLSASQLELSALQSQMNAALQGGASQVSSSNTAMNTYQTPYQNEFTANANILSSMNPWFSNQYAPLTAAMGTLGIGQ